MDDFVQGTQEFRAGGRVSWDEVKGPLAEQSKDIWSCVQRGVKEASEQVRGQCGEVLLAGAFEGGLAGQVADGRRVLDYMVEDEVGSQELAKGIVQKLERRRACCLCCISCERSVLSTVLAPFPREARARFVDEEKAA